MTIMEAVHVLDALVDESDPDTDLPNSVHAFQTAERIRSVHPDKDWFHLTGLLHDLGKVMALWGEPQYCVVGDTFPLGCKNFLRHMKLLINKNVEWRFAIEKETRNASFKTRQGAGSYLSPLIFRTCL